MHEIVGRKAWAILNALEKRATPASGLSELLGCPFCGGKVSDHPMKDYQNYYYVCYHTEDCFFNVGKPPLNFTLIPRNYMVDRWQHRAIPRFRAI